MNKKYFIKKINNQLMGYKINFLYIQNLLNEYVSEDKIHLSSSNKRLNEKLKNLETMLKKLRSCDEEIQGDLQSYTSKYFERFQADFRDFLMILRGKNLSSININKYNQHVKESPHPIFLKPRTIRKTSKKQLVGFLKPNIEMLNNNSLGIMSYKQEK